jgi:hypothetical protein
MILARYRIQEEHSSFLNAPTNSGGINRVEKGTSDYTVKLRTAQSFQVSLFVPRGYRVQKTLIIDISYNRTFP